MPELYDKRSQNCATQSSESLKSSKLLGTSSCCVPTVHLGTLETNPLFSTHRKRFEHWDSGKDFFADFQNQEAWEESETRKTENPHF